jgi:hypothetical protein
MFHPNHYMVCLGQYILKLENLSLDYSSAIQYLSDLVNLILALDPEWSHL